MGCAAFFFVFSSGVNHKWASPAEKEKADARDPQDAMHNLENQCALQAQNGVVEGSVILGDKSVAGRWVEGGHIDWLIGLDTV